MSADPQTPRARRLRRMLVLSALYVAQGITFGFVSAVLIPTLAREGVSISEQTGLIALGGVPWVLKALWGPVVDRFGGAASGKQRRTIVVAHVVMAMAVVAMGNVADPSGNVTAVAYLWLAYNLFLSLQDVATDALAIDVLDHDERGRANGFMLAGHAVGVFVGGTLLGYAVLASDMQVGLWIDGAVLLALATAPLLLSDDDLTRSSETRSRESFLAQLRRGFGRPPALLGALLAPLLFLGDMAIGGIAGALLGSELRLTGEQISGVLIPVETGFGVVGFVVAAWLGDRLGHRRLAGYGAVALGTVWFLFGLASPAWGAFATVVVLVAAVGLTTGPFKVGVHAMFMDLTDPGVRATQFVVFMALLNVARTVGPKAGGAGVEVLGFAGMFMVAGLYQVVMLWLLRLLPVPDEAP